MPPRGPRNGTRARRRRRHPLRSAYGGSDLHGRGARGARRGVGESWTSCAEPSRPAAEDQPRRARLLTSCACLGGGRRSPAGPLRLDRTTLLGSSSRNAGYSSYPHDCKYGHDVSGNVVRLSLLRAPTWPDPLADRGQHDFAYALYPHAGALSSGGVIREAHSFNSPLCVRSIDANADRPSSAPARHSLLEADDPGVVISALKAADDGDGTIVRLHEAFGGRRRVRLRSPGATRADRVDLLEEPTEAGSPPVSDGVIDLELRPFELVTLRIR